MVLRGSSPLTRGKQRRPRLRDPEPRLIPAHAGKTSSASSARADLRAHPRSRGENPRPARPSTASAGSSPLTRGKPQELPNLLDGLGLIPAHAGKTSIGCVPLTIPWAHPRSRGENVDRCERVTDNAGSSPLTRGKRAPGRGCRHRRGLIPAHAGKTTTSTAQQQPPRAHPRSRGENNCNSPPAAFTAGSSPLTRGKLPAPCVHAIGPGLIPAHAGKTIMTASQSLTIRAHPRSRGENRGDERTHDAQ